MHLPIGDWVKEEGIAEQEIRERLIAAVDKLAGEKEERSGSDVMRLPVALKMAFATAAGARMMPDSPMVFAPKGPYPSSTSRKCTSIVGTSRWVRCRAR